MVTKATWSDDERDEHARRVDAHLALISGQLAVQGEQIRSILEILTAAKASDAPSLATQIGELIARLDNQNRYLRELAVAVSKLGRDLPLDLVEAIDDNLDIPRRNGRNSHEDGNGGA